MEMPPNIVFTYTGVYVGIFGGLFIILSLLDYSGICNNFVRRLSLKAYKNIYDELTHDPEILKELEYIEELNKNEDMRKKRKGPGLFARIFKRKDAQISDPSSSYAESSSIANPNAASSAISSSPSGDVLVDSTTNKDSGFDLSHNAVLSEEKESRPDVSMRSGDDFIYDEHWAPHAAFKQALRKKRIYMKLRIEDLPDSNWFLRLLKSTKDDRYADMVYYFMNNNSTISMFGGEPTNPFTRGEKRLDYILQHSLALMFSCLIVNSGLDFGEAFALNSFICSPLITIVKMIFYYLTSCPCLEFHASSDTMHQIQDTLHVIGKFMGRIIGLGTLYIFFLAALFSYVVGDFSNLGKYAYQIFIVSQVIEILMTYLLFIRKYIVVNILCFPVIKFGVWYVSWCEARGVDIMTDMQLVRPIPGIVSFNYSRPQDDEHIASLPPLEHWKVLEANSRRAARASDNNNNNNADKENEPVATSVDEEGGDGLGLVETLFG